MTIQLIAVRHHGSNILQCIFVNGGGPDTTYKFQATGFGKTTHRSLTKDEVLEHLRTWRDLYSNGELTIVQQDRITMNRVAGVNLLQAVMGDASQLWEEDYIPNEEGTLPAPFDPEAQADLELHNSLHPCGYGH